MKVQELHPAREAPRTRAGRLGAFAGLAAISCCVFPIVLVLFGLATASEAIALGNRLYGDWGWVFKIVGAAFAAAGVVIHLRRSGECTVQGARRHRAYIARILLVALVVYWVVYGATKLLAAWGS
ncbi:MAG: hypothetical protein WEB06_12905 [Actinomycetota bacterium]